MNMDEYIKQQKLIEQLKNNLNDLYKKRKTAVIELLKLDKQIEKHEAFLKRLGE